MASHNSKNRLPETVEYHFSFTNDNKVLRFTVNNDGFHAVKFQSDLIRELDLAAGTRNINEVMVVGCLELTAITWPEKSNLITRLILGDLDKLDRLDLQPLTDLEELIILNCPTLVQLNGIGPNIKKIYIDGVALDKIILTHPENLEEFNVITNLDYFQFNPPHLSNLNRLSIELPNAKNRENVLDCHLLDCGNLIDLNIQAGQGSVTMTLPSCPKLLNAFICCGANSVIKGLPASEQFDLLKVVQGGIVTAEHMSEKSTLSADALRSSFQSYKTRAFYFTESIDDIETVIQQHGAKRENSRQVMALIHLLGVPEQMFSPHPNTKRTYSYFPLAELPDTPTIAKSLDVDYFSMSKAKFSTSVVKGVLNISMTKSYSALPLESYTGTLPINKSSSLLTNRLLASKINYSNLDGFKVASNVSDVTISQTQYDATVPSGESSRRELPSSKRSSVANLERQSSVMSTQLPAGSAVLPQPSVVNSASPQPTPQGEHAGGLSNSSLALEPEIPPSQILEMTTPQPSTGKVDKQPIQDVNEGKLLNDYPTHQSKAPSASVGSSNPPEIQDENIGEQTLTVDQPSTTTIPDMNEGNNPIQSPPQNATSNEPPISDENTPEQSLSPDDSNQSGIPDTNEGNNSIDDEKPSEGPPIMDDNEGKVSAVMDINSSVINEPLQSSLLDTAKRLATFTQSLTKKSKGILSPPPTQGAFFASKHIDQPTVLPQLADHINKDVSASQGTLLGNPSIEANLAKMQTEVDSLLDRLKTPLERGNEREGRLANEKTTPEIGREPKGLQTQDKSASKNPLVIESGKSPLGKHIHDAGGSAKGQHVKSTAAPRPLSIDQSGNTMPSKKTREWQLEDEPHIATVNKTAQQNVLKTIHQLTDVMVALITKSEELVTLADKPVFKKSVALFIEQSNKTLTEMQAHLSHLNASHPEESAKLLKLADELSTSVTAIDHKSKSPAKKSVTKTSGRQMLIEALTNIRNDYELKHQLAPTLSPHGKGNVTAGRERERLRIMDGLHASLKDHQKIERELLELGLSELKKDTELKTTLAPLEKDLEKYLCRYPNKDN